MSPGSFTPTISGAPTPRAGAVLAALDECGLHVDLGATKKFWPFGDRSPAMRMEPKPPYGKRTGVSEIILRRVSGRFGSGWRALIRFVSWQRAALWQQFGQPALPSLSLPQALAHDSPASVGKSGLRSSAAVLWTHPKHTRPLGQCSPVGNAQCVPMSRILQLVEKAAHSSAVGLRRLSSP
jgi:hypothetical protein